MFKPQLIFSLKNYSKSKLLADIFAGLTVGVVALPLAMAFAIASGLPPERGLFTAIVAGFIISALGGSKVQIGGPTGAFVIIVSGIATRYGYQGLVYCTLMAGVLLIGFGLFRMGALIRFIPFPVTTGFTSGIAVVIFSTQIKDLLGLKLANPPAEFIEKWGEYLRHLHTIDPQATAVGIGTIITILLTRKFLPRIPAMLVGMIIATIASTLLGLDVETIGSRFGQLPRTLPTPHLPGFDLAQMRELVAPAFTVAMLAAIESLLSATVADGMIGGRHRSNTELIAQGIANIGSALFGGIPATGAIARTATNIKSGAQSPVAGMLHAITLALLLLVMAPLAKLIPLAALAGILVVVAYNMSELHQFVRLLKAPRSDVLVLLTTFALTVLVDLTVAVQIGIVLAALLFIRRMAEVTNVGMISRELGGDDREDEQPDPMSITTRAVPKGVAVYEVQGAFFFGAAERFKDVLSMMDRPTKIIILRLRHVNVIDATGLQAINDLFRRCHKSQTTLVLSGIHSQPLIALQKYGLYNVIGEKNICGNIDDALKRAQELLKSISVQPKPLIQPA
jgi:SulP family sulfate permease